jgi:hypothetical protein
MNKGLIICYILDNSELSIEHFFYALKANGSIVNLVKFKEEIELKITSVIAISPKEGSADDVKQLIVDSRADGIEGLEKYSIVLTREEQLLVINEWISLDAFMDYVNGPHNMIELIEHLCDRYDEENVCKAYSGTVIHEELAK